MYVCLEVRQETARILAHTHTLKEEEEEENEAIIPG